MDLETKANKPYSVNTIGDKAMKAGAGLAFGALAGSWVEDAFNLVSTAPIYDDLSTMTAILGCALSPLLPDLDQPTTTEPTQNQSIYEKVGDVSSVGLAALYSGKLIGSCIEDAFNLVAANPNLDNTSLTTMAALGLFGAGVRAYHIKNNS